MSTAAALVLMELLFSPESLPASVRVFVRGVNSSSETQPSSCSDRHNTLTSGSCAATKWNNKVTRFCVLVFFSFLFFSFLGGWLLHSTPTCVNQPGFMPGERRLKGLQSWISQRRAETSSEAEVAKCLVDFAQFVVSSSGSDMKRRHILANYQPSPVSSTWPASQQKVCEKVTRCSVSHCGGQQTQSLSDTCEILAGNCSHGSWIEQLNPSEESFVSCLFSWFSGIMKQTLCGTQGVGVTVCKPGSLIHRL